MTGLRAVWPGCWLENYILIGRSVCFYRLACTSMAFVSSCTYCSQSTWCYASWSRTRTTIFLQSQLTCPSLHRSAVLVDSLTPMWKYLLPRSWTQTAFCFQVENRPWSPTEWLKCPQLQSLRSLTVLFWPARPWSILNICLSESIPYPWKKLDLDCRPECPSPTGRRSQRLKIELVLFEGSFSTLAQDMTDSLVQWWKHQ